MKKGFVRFLLMGLLYLGFLLFFVDGRGGPMKGRHPFRPVVPRWAGGWRGAVECDSNSSTPQTQSGLLYGLEALVVEVEPGYYAAEAIVLVRINSTTGVATEVFGDASVDSEPPLGTAFDDVQQRYLFINVEAGISYVSVPQGQSEQPQLVEVRMQCAPGTVEYHCGDFLGQPSLGVQFSNATDSLVFLSDGDGAALRLVRAPLDQSPVTLSPFTLPDDEVIPAVFPSAINDPKRQYFFTTLANSSNPASAQVRLYTAENFHIDLTPLGVGLVPRATYISFLAYDSVWDTLVALVGLAGSSNSLPSWVKINPITAFIEVLCPSTDYAMTNVFSYAYNSMTHTFFFIEHLSVTTNRLITLSLSDGSITRVDVTPALSANTPNSTHFYGGLAWQPF